MTPVSDSPDIDLLHRAWEAIMRGDLGFVESVLAPDAKWRALEDGPWNCEDRATIIDVMQGNLARGLRGRIEETVQDGPRVMVAFRPDPSRRAGESRAGALAYMVVTVRDGKIVEMKGCANRAAATSYMHTGVVPDAETLDTVRPPDLVPAPAEQRVSHLVPFVRVGDVERSAAFYEQLGFIATSVFAPRGRLVWAALESEGAELMLSGPGEPIDAEREGVLFYLYAHDLSALRDQLIAAGVPAGEIEDGTPGPREEMRVIDPDGYVLMVAQIEPATGA
jgi:ketosteroid isomerase-like protein